ncbi:MAG: hypothetical protein ABW153_13910 [Sedimenticola sp.]
MDTPTRSFYQYLEAAYDHFNKALFNSKLPACLLTIQREKNVMGYFSANRWTDPSGAIVHEIAINPTYFARHNLLEVMQTIVQASLRSRDALWDIQVPKTHSIFDSLFMPRPPCVRCLAIRAIASLSMARSV